MTHPEHKDFPTAAIATMATGIAMCEFGKAAELAEWIIGHPIWTHEYPAMFPSIQAAVLEQFPGMPTTARSGPDYHEDLAAIEARFGKTLVVRKGVKNRGSSPIDTLVDALRAHS